MQGNLPLELLHYKSGNGKEALSVFRKQQQHSSATRGALFARDIQVKQPFIPACLRCKLVVLIICALRERTRRVFISLALLSAAEDFVTSKIKLSEIEI